MNKYDYLLDIAERNGVMVCEKKFKSDAKGLCKGSKIGISKDLANAEKACVLAEELGHYFTTVGNILDQSIENNRKQEKVARVWGYNHLIRIDDLIQPILDGCSNIFEVAEFLEVTAECLLEIIGAFKEKYGTVYIAGEYKIIFNDYGYCVLN